MFITGLDAIFFGLMIGGISYRMLRLIASTNMLSTIAIIIAAVGGAAVTTLLQERGPWCWCCSWESLSSLSYSVAVS